MNKIWKVIVPALAVSAAGIICVAADHRDTPVLLTETAPAPTTEEQPETEAVREVWVYVSGNVAYPGVYCLPEDSRVFEALEMAGGMTDQAAEEGLNLAQRITDGQQIYVPGISDAAGNQTSDSGSQADGRININTASVEELKTLPGIGDAKARAIIEYRSRQPFQSIEDIMNVSGIKENSFQLIRDLICI